MVYKVNQPTMRWVSGLGLKYKRACAANAHLKLAAARVFPSQNITCDCQAFLFLKVHALRHFV